MAFANRHHISPATREARTAHGSTDATPDLPWFRLVVVAAIVASVWITWPLWDPREQPIVLPVVGLPQMALGPLLVAASLLALLAPRAGSVVVTMLVGYGMATDQTRMQPEFFSLPLLLWGSLPSAGARLIARASLISIWFFAGLHKLLSPDFLQDAGPRLVRGLPISLPGDAVPLAAVGIAVLEIGTAALALVPATRKMAAWSALALHAGIIITFSPMSETRNIAVWPWNVALALSGFALIAPWTTPPLESLMATTLLPRAIAVLLAVAPVGYYLGVVDAYPAHHLYSAGTATATVYCPAGCRPEQDINASWDAFNVPLPPEPRLFEAVFRATCAPGDVLRIMEPHPPPWSSANPESVSACPTGSLPASHP